MRDGNNVPGIAGQRARFESLDIVDEKCDDHFDKFVREGVWRSDSGCPWSPATTQYTIDLGFAPVPDDANKEGQPFATSRMRWSEVVMGSFSRWWYLIRRTWVSSNNIHSRLVETSPWWTKRKFVQTPLRPV